jgi:hypothetical protein
VTAEAGSNRVNRGGSWNNTAANCRSANRNNNSPDNRNNNLGFRLLSTRLCQRGAVYESRSCATGHVQAGILCRDFPAKSQSRAAFGRLAEFEDRRAIFKP